ncbi:MAG: SagB/ThcOx family dehydrogenase, partial [Magnetococcales bacterium]|nr:SagB/ThcOx family dehydrogenase [Magnetococcales bacterium]
LRPPAFDATDGGQGEAEREEPVMLVGVIALPQQEKWQVEPLVQLAKQGSWQGFPNRLTPGEWRSWPLVAEAMEKSRKPATIRYARERPLGPPLLLRGESPLASRLIRQRRSGQSYDGRAMLGREGFLRIMDRALVRDRVLPWDLLPWRPQVHMVVLVHRCEGMANGAYLLARDGEGLQRFRHQSNPVFAWSIPAGTPDSIPLYTLLAGDCRKLAASSSCHQEMAADGVFMVAMVVDMKGALQQGRWNYRALHWEAGVLGQMLYLEAEAEGLNGTGIGCFFDDLLMERLGLQGQGWQVIYQFTVGRALVDKRLTTLPAYTLPAD